MAFTKNPTDSSHAVRRIVPTDEPLLTSSVYVNSGSNVFNNRFINCYPELEKLNQDNPVLRIHKREGWTSTQLTNATVSGSNAGGSFPVQATNMVLTNIFFTYGAGLFYYNYTTGVVTSVSTTGTLNYIGTLSNAIDSSNAKKIAVLEGGGGATTYLTTCDEDGTNVVTTNLVALTLDGGKGLVFLDGYLFAVNRIGNKIYNSQVGGVLTTWTSTNFLDAEMFPDPIFYIEKHHNYLVAFGATSTEFFYDAAIEVGSPLARQESYASRVGLYTAGQGTFFSSGSRYVARVNDDLYFAGVDDTSTIGLYRIKNFRIERVGDSSFMRGVFNSRGLYQLSSFWIGDNECILCEFLNSTSDGGGLWCYMIEADTWIQVTGSDTPSSATSLVSKPFVIINPDSTNTTTGTPMYLTASNGLVPKAWRPSPTTVSVTATYLTKMTDFDTNRIKSIHRVDAIGDFGTNVLTLSYNTSPIYATGTQVSTYAVTPNTIGAANNVSWYNLGAFRRFSLGLSMVGTMGIFECYDVEYNTGVA